METYHVVCMPEPSDVQFKVCTYMCYSCFQWLCRKVEVEVKIGEDDCKMRLMTVKRHSAKGITVGVLTLTVIVCLLQ